MTLANVAIISLLAVGAPLLARASRRAAVPVIVVEILLGIAAGPHGLGWVEVDGAVDTLALLGVTFLFFLAGLDVDLGKIRGTVLQRSLVGYALGLAIALGLSFALSAAGLLDAPVLVAIALSATGLGLVVPILRNGGLAGTPDGVQVIALASVAEFAAVVLLALVFGSGSSPVVTVLLLAALATVAVVVTLLGARLRRARRVTAVVDGLSGGTVQLRVRLSVALVIGFAALAQLGGLEVVLGAFFAGGILNVLDTSMSDPVFRAQLDGLGLRLPHPAVLRHQRSPPRLLGAVPVAGRAAPGPPARRHPADLSRRARARPARGRHGRSSGRDGSALRHVVALHRDRGTARRLERPPRRLDGRGDDDRRTPRRAAVPRDRRLPAAQVVTGGGSRSGGAARLQGDPAHRPGSAPCRRRPPSTRTTCPSTRRSCTSARPSS